MSKTIIVPKNANMFYKVTKDGYKSVASNVIMDSDKVINVSLELNLVTFTINPTPSDAVVTLTADGYTQRGNSISVAPGTTVNYSVTKDGYKSVASNVIMDSDKVINVSLELNLVTFTINPTPSDAVVTLTADGYTQSGNGITVASGTTVNYSVSKDGYITATGSEVCTINRTFNCTLEIKRATVVFNECTSFASGNSLSIYLNDNLVKTATSDSDFPYTLTCDIGDVIGTESTGMHGYDFNDISCFRSVPGSVIENTVTQYDNIVSDIKVSACCVPYYSQILYSDLTTKNAEDVKVGDKLLGYNEQTNTFEEVEVLNILKRYREELYKVTFEDKSFIELTPDHPILTDCGWCVYDAEKYTNYSKSVDLHTLEVGMKVLKADGTTHSVQDIAFIQLDEMITVYTFDTSNAVNTFIAENCVVHNVSVC